jgi:hypothetical protein
VSRGTAPVPRSLPLAFPAKHQEVRPLLGIATDQRKMPDVHSVWRFARPHAPCEAMGALARKAGRVLPQFGSGTNGQPWRPLNGMSVRSALFNLSANIARAFWIKPAASGVPAP